MKAKGFTITEVLIVVAIVAILAAVIYPLIYPAYGTVTTTSGESHTGYVTRVSDMSCQVRKENGERVSVQGTHSIRFHAKPAEARP